MFLWSRRIFFAAALALGLIASGAGAASLVLHGAAAWNAARTWVESDGPAVKRAAFVVAGGPVRSGRD